MRLSLRKALKLRKELEVMLAKPDLPLSVDISVLVAANRETPLVPLEAGAATLAERRERQRRLSLILRDLRVAISRENVASDVEQMLADAAHLDRCIAMAKAVAEAEEAPGEEHLSGEVKLTHDALHATERRGYSEPSRTVTASVVTAAMRAAAREELAELRRVREQVEERRLAANAGRGIEIAEEEAAILREVGLA